MKVVLLLERELEGAEKRGFELPALRTPLGLPTANEVP